MSSATVSAKVPEELRQKLKEHGVEVSKVIRRALEEEATALEEMAIRKALVEISAELKGKVSREDVVKAIRSSREER